jgi:hypothetical protein
MSPLTAIILVLAGGAIAIMIIGLVWLAQVPMVVMP